MFKNNIHHYTFNLVHLAKKYGEKFISPEVEVNEKRIAP
jgi:hypothetical protein